MFPSTCSRWAQHSLHLFGLLVGLVIVVHLTTLHHHPAANPGAAAPGVPVMRKRRQSSGIDDAAPHAPQQEAPGQQTRLEPVAVATLGRTAMQPAKASAIAGTNESGDCGDVHYDLIVGILASPSTRSSRARDVIRRTWSQLPTNGMRVLVKFLLALDAVSDATTVRQQHSYAHTCMAYASTRTHTQPSTNNQPACAQALCLSADM